jgi:hypothetical protein
MRILKADEVLWTLDVNQWLGAFAALTGRSGMAAVKINLRSGSRLLSAALNGADRPMLGGGVRPGVRTLDGKRVVIATSMTIRSTFVTVATRDYGATTEEALAWFNGVIKNLNAIGGVFFDTDTPEWSELTARARMNGIPDGDDESVTECAQRTGSTAIVGLDGAFQDAAEALGYGWIDPMGILNLIAA